MARPARYPYPLFAILQAEGRHMLWLARRIGYSHSHVRNVAAGQFPASPRFRRACAEAMGLPEADLFDHDHSSTVTPPDDASEPGRVDHAGTVAGPESYRPQEVAVK